MSLTDAMPPPITISPGVRPSIPMLVGAAHRVHRLVDQGHDVVPVMADQGVGQRFGDALGKRRTRSWIA